MKGHQIGVQKSLYSSVPPSICILQFVPFPMPPSSLEERVRILCDRAIAANTQPELDAILPELKAAIRDHIRYVRAVAVEIIPEAFGKRSNVA